MTQDHQTMYPADIEQYVREKLASGEFQSRDDFATAAARIYRDLELRHQQLKADIRAAVDQADRGESAPLDIEALIDELTRGRES
jgi:Arc/MetJ-type ribon-helix-helix transcriptional regulator